MPAPKAKITLTCPCGKTFAVHQSKVGRARYCSTACLYEHRKMPPRTHGLAGRESRDIYSTWTNMVSRCTNPEATGYSHYGGRGIDIHGPWVHDVVAFANWVHQNLGSRPPRHTLDRIDNDRGYYPGNLRWANGYTQATNRRSAQNATSPLLGVSWAQRSNRWRAQIMRFGTSYDLGYFNTQHEAHQAYLAKRDELSNSPERENQK